MSRLSAFVLLACVVLMDKYSSGSLIRAAGDEFISTKEVPVSSSDEVAEQNDLTAPIEVSSPIDVASTRPDVPDVTAKQCAKIGEFCNSHSDCCTYACLGYMKRCVSGSG